MTEPGRGQHHVFLVVPHGAAARYLLRSGIVETLREGGVTPVALVPNPDESYLRHELEGQGVIIAQLEASEAPTGRVQTTLAYIRQNVLGQSTQVATLRSRYANARRNLARSRPTTARALDLPIRLLRRSRLMRRGLLRLEELLHHPRAHRQLFARYQPALLVTTSPGWFLTDAVMLREARREGVRTAALVLGWDNPTSKGYRGARPDVVVAWSERMATQLVAHHDLDAARIVVGGSPQLDIYARPTELPARDELFADMGLDPARRLVLFACRSPSTYSHNVTAARALAEAMARGRLGSLVQMVVRPHPINLRSDHRCPLLDYEDLSNLYDNLVIDFPTVMSERLSCDVPAADYLRLAGLIAHCDVLVNAFSTTTLEAFLLDKPVVLISDEAHRSAGLVDSSAEGRPFHLDTHMRSSLEAARVAHSFDELIQHVAAYLEDPSVDEEPRRKIALTECGPLDGRRGEHIGRHLVAQIASDGECPSTPLGFDPAKRAPVHYLVLEDGSRQKAPL